MARPTLAEAIRKHALYMGQRVALCGNGMRRIALDVRGRFDSALFDSAAEYMATQEGSSADRMQALRRHLIMRDTLDTSYDQLSRRGAAAVAEAQAKVYIEDQAKRAKVFDAYTHADIDIVAQVEDAELESLRSAPIDGMTIAEQVTTITDRWFDSVQRAIMGAFAGERGQARDGFLVLKRKLDTAFKAWTDSMVKLAQAAGSVAMRESGAEFSKAFGAS